MENIPTMLSVRETARKTKVSETYIRQLLRDKEIVFVKSGKKYLVNLERFIDYLNNQE